MRLILEDLNWLWFKFPGHWVSIWHAWCAGQVEGVQIVHFWLLCLGFAVHKCIRVQRICWTHVSTHAPVGCIAREGGNHPMGMPISNRKVHYNNVPFLFGSGVIIHRILFLKKGPATSLDSKSIHCHHVIDWNNANNPNLLWRKCSLDMVLGWPPGRQIIKSDYFFLTI